ncbi:unnamed protein product, partial [marine sediment metagenome]
MLPVMPKMTVLLVNTVVPLLEFNNLTPCIPLSLQGEGEG